MHIDQVWRCFSAHFIIKEKSLTRSFGCVPGPITHYQCDPGELIIAYCIRMCKNISLACIVVGVKHIDHDNDGEPWPIVIEDYHGNTNEVYLQTGDLLLYESSKNYHGRPKKFKGSWYSSVFVHYYPEDWDQDREARTHYRVPPIWAESINDEEVEDLEVIGTSMKEPSCAHNWCAMSNSVVWNGPAEAYGVVQSAHGRAVLEIPPEDELLDLQSDLEGKLSHLHTDLKDEEEL
jgi:hypothetical protein